jgi:hypothetical protein
VADGLATLALCKPLIRERCVPGDWIVGICGKYHPDADTARHGAVRYAAEVAECLTVKQYAERYPLRPDQVFDETQGIRTGLTYVVSPQLCESLLVKDTVVILANYVNMIASSVSVPPQLVQGKHIGEGYVREKGRDAVAALRSFLASTLAPVPAAAPAAAAGVVGAAPAVVVATAAAPAAVAAVAPAPLAISSEMKVVIDELSVLLDDYQATGQQRDKKKKKLFSLLWQFYAGRSIRARTTTSGNPTWSYPHNCEGKDGKGVYMKDVVDGGI